MRSTDRWTTLVRSTTGELVGSACWLPPVQVNNFGVWPPIWSLDDTKRSARGVADRQHERQELAIGEPEDRLRLRLVLGGGMRGPDTQVGRRQSHGHRGLSDIEGEDGPLPVVVGHGRNKRDGGLGAGYMAGPLPNLGKSLQPGAVSDDNKIPGLQIAGGGRPPSCFEDTLEVVIGDGGVAELAHVASRSQCVPCLHRASWPRVTAPGQCR